MFAARRQPISYWLQPSVEVLQPCRAYYVVIIAALSTSSVAPLHSQLCDLAALVEFGNLWNVLVSMSANTDDKISVEDIYFTSFGHNYLK